MFIRILAILFLFSLVLLDYSLSEAAKPTPPALEINNTDTLNFGTTVKPKFGSSNIVVGKNSNIISGTTAIMLNEKDVSAGKDRISGDKDNTIQIDLTQCASNRGLGLTIKDFDARYSGNTFLNSGNNLDAPGNGKNLVYGATLVVQSSAPAGRLSPCYDITVNYE